MLSKLILKRSSLLRGRFLGLFCTCNLSLEHLNHLSGFSSYGGKGRRKGGEGEEKGVGGGEEKGVGGGEEKGMGERGGERDGGRGGEGEKGGGGWGGGKG